MPRSIRIPASVLLRLAAVLCLPCVLLLCGCPPADDAKQTSADFNPSSPLTKGDPLGDWAGLRLGMNQLELAQVYNAPDGRGDGFMRMLELYGDVTHHTIIFDQRISATPEPGAAPADPPAEAADKDAAQPEGEPSRKLVLSFYRDSLYSIVDRREGLNKAARDAWFTELTSRYGAEPLAVLPSSNWRWGGDENIKVDFVQDNATEQFMTGRLWISHVPTYEASLRYLEFWESENPDSTMSDSPAR